MTRVTSYVIIDAGSQSKVGDTRSSYSSSGTWKNPVLVPDSIGRIWLFAWKKNEEGEGDLEKGGIYYRISDDRGSAFSAWIRLEHINPEDNSNDVVESNLRATLTEENEIMLTFYEKGTGSGGVDPSDDILSIRGQTGIVGISLDYRRGDNILGLPIIDPPYEASTGVQWLYWENENGADARLGLTGIPGGTQGDQGITGLVGSTGPTGGDQGVTGIQGLQGDTGIQGETGLIGITGFEGETGIEGDQGTTGVGAQGVTGLIGITGLQGTNGSAGGQGVTGLEGSQGETGVSVAVYA